MYVVYIHKRLFEIFFFLSYLLPQDKLEMNDCLFVLEFSVPSPAWEWNDITNVIKTGDE